eukprot:s3007_g1.t1
MAAMWTPWRSAWRRPRAVLRRLAASVPAVPPVPAVGGRGWALGTGLALGTLVAAKAKVSLTETKRKRVAIYGGTFDPPTNSHMTCASEIVNSGCADEVWIVPCGPRPDKPHLKTSPMDRYCMCQIAVNSCFAPAFPVKVLDIEAYRDTAFYTYDMLCELRDTYPDIDFSFVIGSDWLGEGRSPQSWVSLNKAWKPGMPEDQKVVVTGDQLLREFDVLVLPRPGHTVQQLGPRLQWLRMPEDFHLIQGNLSSTQIRERMRSTGTLRDIEGLVPGGVLLFAEPFYRLAHAEADQLPGLVVDRYGEHLCVQPSSGLDALLWPIVDALEEVVKPKVVIIRQDCHGKASLRREVLKGSYQGPSELREHGASFAVDLLSGQKTGWYYDHRDHRLMLAQLASQLPRVLDVYSYVGGFGVLMAHYGSQEVLCIDSSEAALELLRRSAAMNSVQDRVRSLRTDALEFLQEKVKQKTDAGIGETDHELDLVILDPPNLGVDRMSIPKALRHYEKLVTSAAQLVAPNGMLFVASCTYSIGERELMGLCSRSLSWAERDYRLVSTGSQAADHPGHLMLPESRYLRALLLHLVISFEEYLILGWFMVVDGPLLEALASQIQQRLSADQLRAPQLAQICAAYCHARCLEPRHVSELVVAARFSLQEALPLELTWLVRAAMEARADHAQLLLKEAALLTSERAEMLPHELRVVAWTFGPSAAAFLAEPLGEELPALEASVACAELLHLLCRSTCATRAECQPVLLEGCASWRLALPPPVLMTLIPAPEGVQAVAEAAKALSAIAVLLPLALGEVQKPAERVQGPLRFESEDSQAETVGMPNVFFPWA